jgi:hypothetical protein
MTAAASTELYNKYKSFIKTRATFWKPKIEEDLGRMVNNALAEPTINQAIKNLDTNILRPSGLAITLQKIYVDAARVWGGKIYLGVKKQAAKMQRAAMAKKANAPLQPIGYNAELVAEVISYMRLHNLQMVTEITDTMKDFILQQLVEAQRTGASISQVANIVAASNFPANRAIVISRTETIKAANFGAVQAAKKSGFLLEKEWISARDIRTRRTPRDEYSHVFMNGKTVQIDEAFQVPNRHNGFDSLQQPGDPGGAAADVIQCRCTVGFNVIRGANGLPLQANGQGLLNITVTKPPAFVPPKPARIPKPPKPAAAPIPAPAAAPAFVPASTLKEAEDRIKRAGVPVVSLAGMKMHQANAVVKAMEAEAKFKPITDLRSLATYTKNSDEAPKAYYAYTKDIRLNLAKVGKGGKDVAVPYAKQLDDWKQSLNSWEGILGTGQMADSTIKKRIREIKKQIAQREEWISRGYTTRFFSLSASYSDEAQAIFTTVTHEMGHYRHIGQLNGRTDFDIDLKNAVTEYAESAKVEWFAEWYAYYRINGPANVPAEMLKLFNL